MKKASYALLLLIVPVGCFPWSGSSIKPAPHSCPACAGKNGTGNCPPRAGPAVSPQDVTPANARAQAKALEEEMERPPPSPPDVAKGAGPSRR